MNDVLGGPLPFGYMALFAFVFAEQIGLPLPAIPILMGMGALAGAGRISLAAALLVAVLASLLSDLIWYRIGRSRGRSVLGLLCRISLERDSCVGRTERLFARHGAWALLLAKFVPGLSLIAPPLAGTLRMHPIRFFAYDGAAALLWAGAYSGAGYVFRGEIDQVLELAGRTGGSLLLLIGGILGAYAAWKFVQRRRFLREHRIARIAPEELMRKLEAGEDVVVIDLRTVVDAEDVTIPGALRLLPAELEARHEEIARDRDIVLYCSCPNEVTAARMAHRLRSLGIDRVRPLAGGVEAWRAAGFPVESSGENPGPVGATRFAATPFNAMERRAALAMTGA